MDVLTDRVRRFFATFKSRNDPLYGNKEHHRHREIITSNPYDTVCLAGATVARTRVISNSQNPTWNEHFKIPLAHPVSLVEFYVKDNEVFGADLIGTATVSAERILSGEAISDWFPVLGSFGKPSKPDCAVRLEMKFTKCEDNSVYQHGIAGDIRAS